MRRHKQILQASFTQKDLEHTKPLVEGGVAFLGGRNARRRDKALPAVLAVPYRFVCQRYGIVAALAVCGDWSLAIVELCSKMKTKTLEAWTKRFAHGKHKLAEGVYHSETSPGGNQNIFATLTVHNYAWIVSNSTLQQIKYWLKACVLRKRNVNKKHVIGTRDTVV